MGDLSDLESPIEKIGDLVTSEHEGTQTTPTPRVLRGQEESSVRNEELQKLAQSTVLSHGGCRCGHVQEERCSRRSHPSKPCSPLCLEWRLIPAQALLQQLHSMLQLQEI